MALKDQLRELRTARGMTQETVAEELGVSSQTVSKWERGLLSPDISLLPKIAILYQCSIDSLFQMNTVRGIEHRKEFESRVMEMSAQQDWEGMYKAWIQEIDLDPDRYSNYVAVMKHVVRRQLFDREHIRHMLTLADHADMYCTDDDVRYDIYRIMVELCAHSQNSAIKEKAKVYYNKIPRLRHSREIYAKFVMEGKEYRRQTQENILHLIDLTECSVRQMIHADMPPEEQLFYYRKASALYESVLDDRYGGFYDVPLLSNYAHIASLLSQIGRDEEASLYVNRVLNILEKHMSETERDNISPLLYSSAAPGSASTEKMCMQVMYAMLQDGNLAEYENLIRNMLSRYGSFFSVT